jgi:signal transduction histidine kinase
LPRRYADPEFREKFLRIVGGEVARVNQLVQRLLDFAKPSAPVIRPVPMGSLARETVELLHPLLLTRHVRVRVDIAPAAHALGDVAQLRQVLLNVLLNGVEAMEAGGILTVLGTRRDDRVTLAIRDTGIGIPKAELSRIFDPFYTTKPHGTGLGLSVAHSIVREHGGRIQVMSEAGRGTCVQIELPAANAAEGEPDGSREPPDRG